MFRTLLLTFAEFEREQIRDRNMAGRYAKASSGQGWASGIPPFGFEVGDDGHLVENTEEADAVRFMFRQRAQGRSLREVAKAANDRGYTPRLRRDSKTGEPIPQRFTSGSVSQYLQNDAYKGVPVVRHIAPAEGLPAEPFEFPVPALVQTSVWDKANEVNNAFAKGGHKPVASQRPYALRGRIWHRHGDESEATMFGQARKNSEGMTRYYRCTASRKDNKRDLPPTCDGFGFAFGHDVTSVQSDWVEAYTLVWVLDQLADPERLEQLIADADAEVIDGGDETVDVDDLRIRSAQLRAQQDRWTEQYAEGLIDRPTRDARLGKIQDERDAIEREIARAQAHDVRVAGLVLDVDALLGMDIEEGEDWVGSEPPRGSSQWWSELRSAATTTITQPNQWGVFTALPDWVVEEVADLVEMLDLHVVLQKTDDPKRPSVRINFAPSALAELGSAPSTAYAKTGNNQHNKLDDFGVSDLAGRSEVWGFHPLFHTPCNPL